MLYSQQALTQVGAGVRMRRPVWAMHKRVKRTRRAGITAGPGNEPLWQKLEAV